MRRVGFFGGAVLGLPGPYLALGMYAGVGESALAIYKQAGDTLTKLGGPYPMPYQDNHGSPIAISPDGQHLAVDGVTSSESAGLKVFTRTGDAFNKTAQNLSAYRAHNWLAYSPDSAHLALAAISTTPLTVLKRTGDSYSVIFTPAISGANHMAGGCAYTADGSKLIASIYRTDVGGANATITLYVYSRSGDTYTQASALAVSGGSSYGVLAISRDGTYVAMAGGTTTLIYKLSGTTLTYLTSLASGTPNGAAWSPDGSYLAVGLYNSPGIAIYKRTGDSFAALSTPSQTSNEGGYPAFSADGQYLVIADNVSPYMRMYKRSGDAFNYLSPPASPPGTTAYYAAFFPSAFF